jgi:hypothetical protein
MLRNALWLGSVLFVGGTAAFADKRKHKGGYDRHKPEKGIQKS